MSTHKVEVVPVTLKPHPNADSLSIVEVYGYTVCVRTADWLGKDRGAYVPPDSLVDTTRPEFAFLAGHERHERIKVKKLRGVVSMGLLMPTEAEIGSDVMEAMGVRHYEPPIKGPPGTPGGPSLEATSAPSLYAPVYDVENARRYGSVFVDGEPVIVTEKIHGANGRWVFDGEMHCGSRNEWKRECVGFPWAALGYCPWLRAWCEAHPGFVVYGEVFGGQVQDLKYGRSGIDVVVFDLLEGSRWLDAGEARRIGQGLSWVPVLAETEWRWPSIAQYAEGCSTLADHVREGCVVKPIMERTCLEIGRVQAKLIGNGYLERA